MINHICSAVDVIFITHISNLTGKKLNLCFFAVQVFKGRKTISYLFHIISISYLFYTDLRLLNLKKSRYSNFVRKTLFRHIILQFIQNNESYSCCSSALFPIQMECLTILQILTMITYDIDQNSVEAIFYDFYDFSSLVRSGYQFYYFKGFCQTISSAEPSRHLIYLLSDNCEICQDVHLQLNTKYS